MTLPHRLYPYHRLVGRGSWGDDSFSGQADTFPTHVPADADVRDSPRVGEGQNGWWRELRIRQELHLAIC